MIAETEPSSTRERDPDLRSERTEAGIELIAGFLPGLLAGTLLTGLLFFLNVELPFEFGPVARGVMLYGSLLGFCTTAASFVLLPRGVRTAWRALPWTVTVVLVVAAITCGVHASRYSLYLPPGINVRLIKAGIWLSIGGLIYFYTALLHTLHNRPYGPRSRVLLISVAIASVYVMGERREAFEPAPPIEPLPTSIAIESRPQLWVIGIEGATLDAILPLAEQGLLPAFSRLLDNGAYARLRSFTPVKPIVHWTTLVTGKFPYQHGVLGPRLYAADFLTSGATLELTPIGTASGWRSIGREMPLSKHERQSPNLWEIFGRLGLNTGVAGWPVSHPGPEGAAFAFSQGYFSGHGSSASPREFAERGLMFRPTSTSLDGLIDDAFSGNDSTTLRRGLEADEWRINLMTFLSDQKRDVDAHFVLLPGLSTVSRQYFGGFEAVQSHGSTRERYQQASRIVMNYYQFLDNQIAQLLSRTEPSRLVAIISPFGYTGTGGLEKIWTELSGNQLKGTTHGAPDGVFLLSGDEVRGHRFLERADLIDLVPTLLYGLGLPVARDLEGRVLTQAFEPSYLAHNPLTFVPSYETVAREGSELRRLLDDELDP